MTSGLKDSATLGAVLNANAPFFSVRTYFDINLDILWKTVTEDLSMLNSLLEPILDRIKSV